MVRVSPELPDAEVRRRLAALAAGASSEEAARLANYAGGIVVMKRGTATVTHDELMSAVRSEHAAG